MVKIYAHRGYHSSENIKENSIESLIASHKAGFSAIEFDIWYLNNELVITHNKPSEEEFHKLPRLTDYFLYKNDFTYWLDFKNLNEENTIAAISLLKKIIATNKINEKQLYFAPFETNFSKLLPIIAAIRNIFNQEINIVAVCEEIAANQREIFYQKLQKNKIEFLSIKHTLIEEDFIKIFHNITLFAWTVNNIERLNYLKKIGVKNFASDLLTPQPSDL